jgi:hypothetical protein
VLAPLENLDASGCVAGAHAGRGIRCSARVLLAEEGSGKMIIGGICFAAGVFIGPFVWLALFAMFDPGF